ncbi:protein kinase [Candidatus Uabimicrobium sp. HlEnr_7]|uniref:protein kinase domain-containing protein n=1 Tax=Candidatus Uabimicrobium helgolandensis TaxID=3095367 RepID=UPI003557F471
MKKHKRAAKILEFVLDDLYQNKIENKSTNADRKLVAKSKFGKYTILEKIGDGGMGIVYKAQEDLLNRIVAIKTIRSDKLANNPRKISRFRVEMELSAKLNHVNIVKVYTAGVQENTLFLAMEYLQGTNLRNYLNKNKISFNEKLSLFIQMVEAINHAHKHKIVHRDIKPENIMVTNEQRIVVMDFGIAKAVDKNYKLTQTGEIIGTWTYMAPEQINPKLGKIDARSDIYALGAILYEIFADKPMANVENFFEVSLQEETSIPQNLKSVWHKCIVRDKNKRYKNAKILLRDLQKIKRKKKIQEKKFFSIKTILSFSIAIYFSFLFYNNISFSPNILNMKISVKEHLKYAFALNKQGKYESELKQLMLILKYKFIDKNLEKETMRRTIVLCCKLKKYNHAIKHFAQCQKTQRIKIFPTIIEAFYYKKLFSDIKKIHLQTQNYNYKPSQRFRIDYYLGKMQYDNNSYDLAFNHFQKAKTSVVKEKHLELAILNAHLGQTLYHMNDPKQALLYLKSSLKNAPAFAKTYLYITKCYLQNMSKKQILQALPYLKKYLIRTPRDDKAWVLLGKCYLVLLDFQQAIVSFNKALAINPTNFEASQYLAKNYLTVTDFPELCENIVVSHILHVQMQRAPNNFHKTFNKIYRYYQQNYYEVMSLKNKNKFLKKEFQKQIIDNYKDKGTIEQKLLQQRYSPNIEVMIQKIQNNSSEILQKKLQKIRDKIINLKKQEQKFVLYYSLAACILYDDYKIIELIPNQDIYKLLNDSQESLEIRYLSAKIILSRDIRFLENGYKAKKRIMLSALCQIVLHEAGFYKNEDKILKKAYSHNRNLFWRTLVISALSDKKYLLELMENKNKQIRFYSAVRIVVLSKIQEKISHRARETLRQFLSHTNQHIKLIAHYHFWKKKKYSKQEIALFFKFLQQSDNNLKRCLLLHLLNINIADHFEKIAEIAQSKIPNISITAIMVMAYWQPFHPKMSEIIRNELIPSLIRMITMRVVFFSAKYGPKKNEQLIAKKLSNLGHWLETIEKNDQTDKFTRMFAYYTFLKTLKIGFFYLEKENDSDIQKTIFFTLLQKRFSNINNTMLKYFNHKQLKIRKASYLVYSYLASRNEKEIILQETHTPLQREAIARGLFLYLRNTMKPVQNDSFRKQFIEFEINFKWQQEFTSDYFLELISQSITLNPQAEYYYMRAAIYKMRKQYTQAAKDLELALNQKNSLLPQYTCLVELLHILWIQGNKTKIQQLLTKYPLICTGKNLITLWRMRDRLIVMSNIPEIQQVFVQFCKHSQLQTIDLEKINPLSPKNTISSISKEAYFEIARMFARINDKSSTIRYLKYCNSYFQLTQQKILSYPVFHIIKTNKWLLQLPKK